MGFLKVQKQISKTSVTDKVVRVMLCIFALGMIEHGSAQYAFSEDASLFSEVLSEVVATQSLPAKKNKKIKKLSKFENTLAKLNITLKTVCLKNPTGKKCLRTMKRVSKVKNKIVKLNQDQDQEVGIVQPVHDPIFIN
ncbi:MAG: hypothetical protein H6619_05890 [Deltaproteobacteria bacterium]|nr:hypothetical protein [Deltaproteobacteria bacterium]